MTVLFAYPGTKFWLGTPRTKSSLWRVTDNLLKFTREYRGILVSHYPLGQTLKPREQQFVLPMQLFLLTVGKIQTQPSLSKTIVTKHLIQIHISSLVPRLPHSRTRTLKLCRRKGHLKGIKGREGVERS